MNVSSISSSMSAYSMRPPQPATEQVEDAVTASDIDGSGGLNKDEFNAFGSAMKEASGEVGMPGTEAASSKMSSQLFDKMDANKDGEVTAEEIEEYNKSMSSPGLEDGSDISDMLEELMAQNQQIIMDMADSSSSSSDDEDNGVINKQYLEQVQQYMNQANATGTSSASNSATTGAVSSISQIA